MKILVTGAFGSVGINTVNELIKKGESVRILELRTRANEKIYQKYVSKVEMIWGDIRDKNIVTEAVKGVDRVIHLAFVIPSLSEEKPNWAWEINVEGTRNLLAAMSGSGKRPKIVFASSVSVFGKTQELDAPRRANEQVRPTDNYSHHKVACEQLVKISGMDWTILRIGAVLSVSLCRIDPMLFDVQLNNRIEIIHARDAGLAFANAAVNTDVWGKTLLIGGGRDCQIYQKDFIKKVLDAVGIGMLPEKAFTSKPFYTDWMDTKESQELLDYQKRGLADFIVDIKKFLGVKRFLAKAVQPILVYWLLRRSPYFMAKRVKNDKIKIGNKGNIAVT